MGSAQPLTAEAAGWLKERLQPYEVFKKRILNIECRSNVFCLFYKKDRA
jgi:hypothetical protein